ncbi:multidrug transporter [Desulfobacter hydrogenophilus]|jgi:multidrug efflux system outer membrane protein|uniref:Efflux transporter outer membrane subunit n=1 Tax=Desulfobacter hydrogenophilus TaxID=2291 RepID=A0A328FGU9_9BACT|nr:efflux transporter outer membrane subunit [Desulfobacter hydrogenophilus]NDY73156.1 efflux transporter outer membrane subunit [Desulfobacter hydrogenophilus]QBH14766.1 efflux transporter outer membrane subunit [Desulfobacter hydrogenophilus]RAM03798.1 multidrug transporter [Desulfobacter hydrogenophilus]
MIRKILVVIGVFVFLGGCSLAPKYQQPRTPISDTWPQGEAYGDTQSVSGIPAAQELNWQDFFTDQKLKKIIETALDNNRDLRIAALNVEKARAQYGVRRAELFPALDASGAGSKQGQSKDLIDPGEPGTVEQYSADLGIVSWEMDFFGRIRSLKDQALEEYMATAQARRSAQIALISEVSRTYLTFAADRERLNLTRFTFKNQRDSYNLILANYQTGLATRIDLRRAQTQADAARRDVQRYIQLAAQDLNALNLLAGTQVPEAMLPNDLSSVPPVNGICAGLSSQTLLNRPDIVAAEHRLKGAYAFIGAARAAFFPRISLTASMGTASDELSGLFGSGSDTWNFAPGISMPIFDTRVWAALRVSKADRKIILAEYEKAIQTAFRETADALAVRGTIDRQVAAQESIVDAATETYSLSNERYNLGIDGYLSVLDAHRFLYAEQQSLISLQLAKMANQITLYTVLGGGDGLRLQPQ